MGIELLIKFGKAVLDEMTQIFAKGSNVVIPFDPDSVKDICSIHGLDYNEVAESFKTEFRRCRAIDFYFSLACCTFQVMIAYDCLATGVRAYNYKLAKFLRFPLDGSWEHELGLIYSEVGFSDNKAKKQEELWENAQKLLKANGLNLWIPNRGNNTGRYVQYPLKQRIIKRSTLKEYIGKFKNRFSQSADSSYSFDDFSSKLFNDIDFLYYDGHKENQTGLSKAEAYNIARRIIFYCYCNWVEHEIQKRGQSKKKEKDPYKVKLKDDKFNLFKNDKEVKTASVTVPLRPFTYDETYNEWLLSYSDLDPTDNITLGVLLDRSQWKNNSLLTGAPYFEWSCSADLRFYINPEKFIERRKKEWFKRENIKFVGGVKDNDGRWILSLLPTVTNITEQNSIIIDHKSYSLSDGSFDLNSISDTMGEGVHFIKLFDRAPISFWTVAPGKSDSIQAGWTWKRRKADFDVAEGREIVLSGLYTNVPSDSDENIKHWGNKKIGRLDDKYDRIVNVPGRKGWN